MAYEGVSGDYRGSTTLLEKLMEHEGVVSHDEAQKLQWHNGHESSSEALRRMKKEPLEEGALRVSDDEDVNGGVGHAAEAGSDLLRDGALEHVAGEAGATTFAFAEAGIKTIHAALKNIANGDELAEKNSVDAVDVAALNVLALDPAFKKAQTAKFDGIVANKVTDALVGRDGKLTELGKRCVPPMQAACDAGSRVAMSALQSGGREAFLKAHPDLRARLDSDVAFAKGFEQVMFASKLPDAQKHLGAIQAGIDSRNATAAVVSHRA